VLEILHGVNVDWMGRRHIAYWFSGICVLISIVSLIMHGGPRYGVDFTGGTLIELQVTPPLPVDNIRRAVDQAGFTGSEIQVLNVPGQYLVRIGLTELHHIDPAPRVREAVASPTRARPSRSEGGRRWSRAGGGPCERPKAISSR
jgi:preprotein translocase subunit SecF